MYDVVIKGTGMGVGEKALADNLMIGFIHVLSEAEKLPEHIMFYGEGVKLTCKGSSSLDDLKALESKGVEILSCGTCLDYYELSDDLSVGRVTTMAEVVKLLSEAAKVVEP